MHRPEYGDFGVLVHMIDENKYCDYHFAVVITFELVIMRISTNVEDM
jgi:hypothetical protein